MSSRDVYCLPQILASADPIRADFYDGGISMNVWVIGCWHPLQIRDQWKDLCAGAVELVLVKWVMLVRVYLRPARDFEWTEMFQEAE